jgi:outer membrane protein OmpU
MKKVLFATTALVATAGVASADVTLSGSAEMGIIGGDMMETQFHTDIDVRFTLSGETDNGLTFGATIDLDEEGGFSNTNGGPEAVFISGNFGTLTMGDTDGAFDWALAEVPAGAGSLTDNSTTHAGWNGNSRTDGVYDGQIARYDHAVGGLRFAISAELDDAGVGDAVIQLGLGYDLDLGGTTLGIGLGYSDYATDDAIGISLRAGLGNGLTVGVNYSDLGDTDGGGVGETHTAIGVSYTMDAFSFGLNWGRYEEGANEQAGWGMAAGYDLGGGASLLFGYGSTTDCSGPAGFVYAGCAEGDAWSFGLSMSF